MCCRAASNIQEAISSQYDSMLILHALTLDPHTGAHIHTHKCIQEHTDTLTKTLTPLLSGFDELLFKASVRCPSAPNITRIKNRLQSRSRITWKTSHLLLALNICI